MATGTAPSTVLPPPPPATDQQREHERIIHRQLDRTRLYVRLVDLTGSLIGLAIGVIGFLLVVALIDHWIVGLGFVGRTVAALVLVGAVVWYLVVQVVPLLIKSINPTYAARTIEEATPTLKNSLVNFLLLRQDRSHVREVVYQAVEAKAASDIATVPVETTIDRSHLIRAGYILCGVMAILAAYKILSPKDPFQTAARVVLPWAEIARPSRVTIVDVMPGDAEVYFGDFAEVSAEVRGVREGDPVTLLLTTADGQTVDRPIPMSPLPGGLRFECQVPAQDDAPRGGLAGMQQDVTYRIVAGDAETAVYELSVVTAPTIVVERLEYQYPAYTKKQPITISGQGDIQALEGTKVIVHATANQPIKSAWIELDPHVPGRPPEMVRLATEGTRAWGGLVLQLKDDRQTPSHETYQVRFYNERGHQNEEPSLHRLEVIRDLPPEVQVLAPAKNRVEVAEDGELFIEVRAVDPDFGLSRLVLRGAAGEKRVEVDLIPSDSGQPPQLTVPYVFRPREHSLVARDELTYLAQAEDNRVNALTGQPEPNVARSREYVLVVIGPKQPQDPNAQPPQAGQNPNQDLQNQDPQNQDPQESNNRAAQPPDQQPQNGGQQPNQGPRENDPRAPQNPPQPGADPNQRPPQGANSPPMPGQPPIPGQLQPQDGNPMGDQPQGTQPMGAQPQGVQPMGAQPMGEKPMNGEPMPGEQGSGNPAGGNPGGSGQQPPGQGDPMAGGQAGGQSEGQAGGQAGQSPPSQSQPGQNQPGQPQPGQNQPGQNQPGTAQPGQTNQNQPGQGQQPGQPGNPGAAGNQQRAGENASGTPQGEPQGDAAGQPAGDETGDGASGDGPQGKAHDGQAIDQILKKYEELQNKLREAQSGGKGGAEGQPQGDSAQQPTGEKPAGEQGASGESTQPDPNGARGSEKPQPIGQQPGTGQAQQDPAQKGGNAATGRAPGQPGQSTGQEGEKQPGQSAEASPMGEEPPGTDKNTEQGADRLPDENQATEQPEKSASGGSGGKPMGPNKTGREPPMTEGTQSEGSTAERQGGAGQNGESGAGDKSNDKSGSGPGQEQNRDQPKDQQGGNDATEQNDPSGVSNSKKQSNSSGGESGDRSGGGKKGPGQSAGQAGNDSAGSNSAGDQGAGKANERGSGETGERAGTDQESSGQTGQAGNRPGEGSQTKANPRGEKTGKSEPGAQDAASGQPGEPRPNQPPGDPSDRRGQQPGGNVPAGGGGGDSTPPDSAGGEAAAADEANLEYARKATELALQKLNELDQNPDPELLDRLGWTKEDLAEFLNRWNSLKQSAEETPDGQRELDEALRSLGLRDPALRRRAGGTASDDQRGLRDSGGRTAPPPKYRDLFESFRKGAARSP
jgi:hypothetical protein